MSFSHFKVTQINDKILHVEVNRPKKFNSFNVETWTQYHDLIKHYSQSHRVIILSGIGDNFCSGIDLSSILSQSLNLKEQYEFIKHFQDCINAPIKYQIPVISISHGISYGLALDIISATTIRLCTKDVKFSIKEIDIGIIADIGSLQRLSLIVGNTSKLNQLALTGDVFQGREALELGLVSQVFDDKESALDIALEIAGKISTKYEPAVIGTKKHLELMNVASDSVTKGLDLVAWDNAKLMSEDSYKKFFSQKFAKFLKPKL